MLGFTNANYESIFFKSFTNHIIGSGVFKNQQTETGKIKHTTSITNLNTIPDLTTLTIRLTNIQYYELGQLITLNKDCIFTFNQ